jgi:LysM repeat protein
VVVAVLLVVRSALHTTHHAASAAQVHHLPATGHPRSRQAFYVVRSGDSLSAISQKTGISVLTLEALNPSVDPNALQAGQRLRLRP